MRWVFACVLGAGCIQPDLLACPGTDLACPINTICDALHTQCIKPDQTTACAGLDDGASCVAEENGYCKDGICLFPHCGNHYVDPGEFCDDGNELDNDGCNATCTSTEVCGNGILDVGEQCDDGNVLAADGCDSQCRPEQARWTVEGVAPLGVSEGAAVYDPAHQQLLVYDGALTYVWNGAVWSSVGVEPGRPWDWYDLIYDPDLSVVVRIGSVDNVADQLSQWTGSAWTDLPITGPTPLFDPIDGPSPQGTYDTAHHVAIVAGTDASSFGATIWSIDVATGRWMQRAIPPGVTSLLSVGLAYDEAHADVVLVGASFAGVTFVSTWNGSSWSATSATPLTNFGWFVVYDPSLGSVVVLGGIDTMGTRSRAAFAWNGASWTALPQEILPVTVVGSGAVYDRARDRLVLFSGATIEACEWTGTTWNEIAIAQPHWTGLHTYDPARRELVQLGGDPFGPSSYATWVWDDHWRLVDPLPFSDAQLHVPPAIAYDPIRNASVVNLWDGSTWLLADEHWQQLAAAGSNPVHGLGVLAFDPIRRATVGIDATGTWALPSDGTTWMQIAGPPSASPITLAFDASTGELIATSNTAVVSLAQGAAGWLETITPGPDYQVVANPRRGSVELVNRLEATWERRGGAWREEPPLPYPVIGSPVYAPATGELIVVGNDGHGLAMVRRSFVGESPIETCADDRDDDGDGLAGCADPDCWWSCTPACPPNISCEGP